MTDDYPGGATARRDGALTAGSSTAFKQPECTAVPGCAARLALCKNLSFHLSCGAAERARFHPCKRCRPNEDSQQERHAELVRKASRLID